MFWMVSLPHSFQGVGIVYLDLSDRDLVVLVSALDAYQEILSERERHLDYWFRSHILSDRKQAAEDNKVFLYARMAQVDKLKSLFLSHVPVN